MTLLEKFGLFIESRNDTKVDHHLMHHARRALLDWQGALLAGSNSQAAKLLLNAHTEELSANAPCSVAGTALRANARQAAFLNGTISHIAEFDDIYRDGAYHPASPTISSVFTLAQARQSTLGDLLSAIITGYEVSARISKAVQPSHYAFFHTTGTVGVFGAAAACAALLRLNASQSTHAMAIAGTFASGLQEAFRSDSMTKPMHAGHAAEVGLNAALCAQAGMTGAPNLLEGAAGFGAAMSKDPKWEQMLEGLGKDFSIEHITFKNHGCCGHLFACIDAVAHLMGEHAFEAADIHKIRIGAYKQTLEVCAYKHPKTPFEAKFSVTYTVAARVILKRVREDAFMPAHFSRADIRELEDKIELRLDEECARHFPLRRSAVVEVHLKDERVLTRHQMTRHGDPDDPLTDSELSDKFHELVNPRTGEDQARCLAQLIFGEPGTKVGELTSHWKLLAE
jgi:2-methylcitrate dehydratase PrpD